MFAFMGLGFTKNQVEEGDLSPYITKEGLEKKFYSFQPSPEEGQRVRERKNKIHDGPNMFADNHDRVAEVDGI